MPYIKPIPNREAIDPNIPALSEQIKDVGDLNYAITRLALRFILDQGLNYTDLNATMGVALCALLEVYRRVGVKYEDLKIFQNGDVPEYAELDEMIRSMQRQLPTVHVPDNDQAHG